MPWKATTFVSTMAPHSPQPGVAAEQAWRKSCPGAPAVCAAAPAAGSATVTAANPNADNAATASLLIFTGGTPRGSSSDPGSH